MIKCTLTPDFYTKIIFIGMNVIFYDNSKNIGSLRKIKVKLGEMAIIPSKMGISYRQQEIFLHKKYGSFHIRLTVDVADLNEIIFFGSLSTINRHVFFCLAKKIFFTNIRFFEFSKK